LGKVEVEIMLEDVTPVFDHVIWVVCIGVGRSFSNLLKVILSTDGIPL
jgi:hypothetical protein